MDRGRQIMEADPRAKTTSGKSTVGLDLNEIAFHACSVTAIDTPDDPKAYWAFNIPYRWFGRDVPGSRVGIDNPDNIYRMIAIDEKASYVIRGRVPQTPPVDVSFTIFSAWPGLIEGNGIFPAALGGITLDEFEVDASGAFSLTFDPSSADGRRNHVQVKSGATLIFIRDSMSDWARETPLYLSVKRVTGPTPKPARTEETLTQIAAQNVERAVKFWLDLPARYYYLKGPNQLAVVNNPAFKKGGQFTANGNFNLKPDEAYVLTLDPLGSHYVGVQLADLFGASLDNAHHTASLSQSQMAPNADGTITYVLSLADPGVYNWLDPSGLDTGLFMFRYQGYDADKVSAKTAICFEKVVTLSQLRSVLPASTRWVTVEERREQLAHRLHDYNRRLAQVAPAF